MTLDENFFGNKLKEARKAAHHTQETIAEALGMRRDNYKPYESGKKYPAPQVVPSLASILGIPENELLAWRVIDEFGQDVILTACKVLEISRD